MPENENVPLNFPRLLAEARAGSAEALGQLLMHYRDYLLLVANRSLEPGLQGKTSPSDLVQETFLEAQRDFGQFLGQRHEELLAWLDRILANNLLNVSRRYRVTQMRALDREVPFGTGGEDNGAAIDVPLDTPAPWIRVAVREEEAALTAAMMALPPHYQRVLHLRHWEHMTFPEIGRGARLLGRGCPQGLGPGRGSPAKGTASAR